MKNLNQSKRELEGGKTPVQKLLNRIERDYNNLKNANLLIASGILEPTIKYVKEELLLEELMRLSTEYQKGYAAGYADGKREASITKV